MSQVCIPSIHKATSNARYLRKKDFENAKKQPEDMRLADVKKRTKHHLHTLSRVGSSPLNTPSLKAVIKAYHEDTGKILKQITSPMPFAGSKRKKGVYLKDLGCVTVEFKHGEEWVFE